MNRPELLELVTKLTAAKQGSVELDKKVLSALPTCQPALARNYVWVDQVNQYLDAAMRLQVTQYLDSALLLIPNTVAVTVTRMASDDYSPATAMAKIHHTKALQEPFDIDTLVTTAATPALAVCIVALAMKLELESSALMDDYEKYRGKCKEMSEALVAADPSLVLVRGYYYDFLWGEQPHWWCKKPSGEIVDPTKYQFPSKGAGAYVEFDGTIACANCGKVVKEEDADIEGNYAFCSYECHGKFVGVF